MGVVIRGPSRFWKVGLLGSGPCVQGLPFSPLEVSLTLKNQNGLPFLHSSLTQCNLYPVGFQHILGTSTGPWPHFPEAPEG